VPDTLHRPLPDVVADDRSWPNVTLQPNSI
jgi:hypothetical protein